jgi:hypothetical protein
MIRVLALGVAFAAMLALPATAAAAGPYEPNDSPPSAAGPLALGQTYNAAIEVPGDRDFYYFYVTSEKAASVRLEVKNLGGGSEVSDVDLTIIDTTTTPRGSIPFIRPGEDRVADFSLQPQKYFIEVKAGEGYGDAYSLSTGGTEGSFGTFGQLSGRCAKAVASVSSLRSALSTSKQKLQRATSRLRRARYGSSDARKRARAGLRHAQDRVTTKAEALRAARAAELPWCSIPQ